MDNNSLTEQAERGERNHYKVLGLARFLSTSSLTIQSCSGSCGCISNPFANSSSIKSSSALLSLSLILYSQASIVEMQLLNFVLLVPALILVAVDARELPEFIHVCSSKDPEVEACITRSVEYLKPYLMKGVPEYNIPSLEPLVLKELVAAEGTGIRVMAKNVNVFGASEFKVTKLKADLDKLRFIVEIALPTIFVKGQYDIDGKVLLLPIRGSGPMTGNFTDCVGHVKFQAELQRGANGEEHIKIVDFRMKISVGKGSLKLDNLFGGERVLGDAINAAINSNFDSFLQELRPLVETALSDAFLEIGNSIVTQFTYQQLFPQA